MTDFQGLCLMVLVVLLQIPLWAIQDQLKTLTKILLSQEEEE